jgi:RNA-dependent RNA polymerase
LTKGTASSDGELLTFRSSLAINNQQRYDRKYWDNFIRVHFTDENGVQVRWDRNIRLKDFLQNFIGEPLHNGITVGGRHFEFLLCSNSSLREHAVWFFEPFDGNTAESIRASIGCFTGALVRQPAKLLARMGQALSATDPTVTLEPHEVEEDVKDIVRNEFEFTDGLGDISQQLADEIWSALNPSLHRTFLPRTPAAFQVTFSRSIRREIRLFTKQ